MKCEVNSVPTFFFPLFLFFVVDDPATIGDESESMPIGNTLGIMLFLIDGSSELSLRATSGVIFSNKFVLDDLS